MKVQSKFLDADITIAAEKWRFLACRRLVDKLGGKKW